MFGVAWLCSLGQDSSACTSKHALRMLVPQAQSSQSLQQLSQHLPEHSAGPLTTAWAAPHSKQGKG